MSVQIEEIRKELTSLKCIVCKRYLSVPPIYNTTSGEYRCGRCSFVKENLSFRATLYEKMALCVTFPCIYQDCDVELSWNDVSNHEAICPKQMMDCPFECDVKVDVKDLVQHFNSVHESQKLSKRNLANESVLKVGEKMKLFYIVSEGEPFVVMFIPSNGDFKFGNTATPNSDNNTAVPNATTPVSGDHQNTKQSTSSDNQTSNETSMPVSSSFTLFSTNTPSLENLRTGQPLTLGSKGILFRDSACSETKIHTQPTNSSNRHKVGTTVSRGFFRTSSSASSDSLTTITSSSQPLGFNFPKRENIFTSTTPSIPLDPMSTVMSSSQPISFNWHNQVPSTVKQCGLSVFSLLPSKPHASFTLTFTLTSMRVDISDQRVEPFITKEHCRKCWFETCKNDLHKPYSIHVNLNEFVTTKFDSNILSKLFVSNNITFSITINNKSIVDEKERGPFVELSKNVQHSLECPICTNIMVPPIFVCATGHAICTGCKSVLKECPTCKAVYTGTRSFALEELYECSRLMCSTSNVENDCDFVGDIDEITKHDRCHETQ